MATKKAIKQYAVDVQRVSYSNFRTIHVMATSAKHAANLAVDMAGDYEYGESSADYNVDSIEEVKLP